VLGEWATAVWTPEAQKEALAEGSLKLPESDVTPDSETQPSTASLRAGREEFPQRRLNSSEGLQHFASVMIAQLVAKVGCFADQAYELDWNLALEDFCARKWPLKGPTRKLTSEHLVANQSDGEHIRCEAGIAMRLLRRYVEKGSRSSGWDHAVFDHLGETEIGYAQATAGINHQVRRLEIAMDDTVGMSVSQALQNLLGVG
jgi:hypothetical protein